MYFKTNETTNQYRCTLVDADDGFPWCSTLTDQNGEHVGGQVSSLHLDDEVDIVVIIIVKYIIRDGGSALLNIAYTVKQ